MTSPSVIVEFHLPRGGPEKKENARDARDALDKLAEQVAEGVFPGRWERLRSDAGSGGWIATMLFRTRPAEYHQKQGELLAALKGHDMELVIFDDTDD